MESNDSNVVRWDATQWLEREDATGREGRLERLKWIEKRFPATNGMMGFLGGRLVVILFEEARYCFVYGQYTAAIMAGMAFIEQSFAAQLYMVGNNHLERANLETLLQEVRKREWITQAQFDELESARKNHDALAHFRRPDHPETLDYRSVKQEEWPYEILEQDAKNVLSIIFTGWGPSP